MATVDIVRIDEIPDCVERVLKGINAGVLAARKLGIQAELPEKVDFSFNVVKDWQVLPIESAESGTTTENQGGRTVETVRETGSESQSGSQTSDKGSDNIHNETSTEKIVTQDS